MTLDMYAENILEHWRNPRNFGELENPDVKFRDVNEHCGDEYEFQMKLSDGIIKDVRFKGDGCAISKASASMLSEFIKGKSISELTKLEPEDIFKLLGISVSPVRIKCALLPLRIIRACIHKKFENFDFP